MHFGTKGIYPAFTSAIYMQSRHKQSSLMHRLNMHISIIFDKLCTGYLNSVNLLNHLSVEVREVGIGNAIFKENCART